MGEIIDWWKSLPGFKKLGYGMTGTLVLATLALHLYNERKFIYDPSKKKKQKLSKWE